MGTAPRQTLTRWYFTLSFLEGLVILVWLFLAQARLTPRILAGLSIGRLALMAPCLILVGAFFWITISLWKHQERSERWAQLIRSLTARDLFYWGIIALCGVVLLTGAYYQAIAARITDDFLLAYLVRLSPYIGWAMILSIQTPIFLRFLRYGTSFEVITPYRSALLAFLIAFSLLLMLAAWITFSRVGLKPDIFGWGIPGVPLLPSQIVLALVIIAATLILAGLVAYIWQRLRYKSPRRLSARTLDILVFLLLWLVAIWRWSAEPIKPTYFVPDPTPPNYEFYPYSDAAAYDLSAQRLLLGLGFESDVIRPIYSLFLALAQGVSGIGYQSVIAWQVPILAFIPSLLYLLAKAIHHRLSGLLLGLLAIFHESNSIALSGVINDSHAKLIMSDLPITLGVILFSLLVVLWLRNGGSRQIYPLLAGGVLAVFMLIRFQIILVLPAILVCSWFALRKHPATWVKGGLVFLLALILTLTPWIWRNYQLTGKIILAGTSNATQAGMVGKRYSLGIPQENTSRMEDESEGEYLARMSGSVTDFALAHPLETAGFINSHYWHNQIASLLVLPASFPILTELKVSLYKLLLWQSKPKLLWDQCCTIRAYIDNLPYWKSSWNGVIANVSQLPLLTSLFLIAAGLGASWGRSRYAGLVPLFVSAAYTVGNALARNSGWRYNLPVDWVGMLLYSIGLVQLGFWVVTFFKNDLVPHSWMTGLQENQAESHFPWKQAVLCAVGFFLLVASIPLSERLIPDRYQALTPQNALASLHASQSGEGLSAKDRAHLETILKDENAVALVGRVLYPRFYYAGEGFASTGWPSYQTQDYPRLGFILLGPKSASVILPLDQTPDYFPNAADGLVIGCQRENHLEARLVAILNDPKHTILTSSMQPWNCDLP
jgi:hypothetical protein